METYLTHLRDAHSGYVFTADGLGAAAWKTPIPLVNGSGVSPIVYQGGTAGTAITVNANNGNVFAYTLSTAATILAPSNAVDGQVIKFRLTQGAGGNFTATWTSGTGGYSFGSGSAPALSTAAGNLDIIGFEYVAVKTEWAYLGIVTGYLWFSRIGTRVSIQVRTLCLSQ